MTPEELIEAIVDETVAEWIGEAEAVDSTQIRELVQIYRPVARSVARLMLLASRAS